MSAEADTWLFDAECRDPTIEFDLKRFSFVGSEHSLRT